MKHLHFAAAILCSRSGLLLFLTLVPVLSGCDAGEGIRESSPGREGPVESLSGRTMGTAYHIDYASGPKWTTEKSGLHRSVEEVLDRVNRMASTFDPGSEISRFNAHRSLEPFPSSPALSDLLRSALALAAETQGAFDPTVGPLVRLFGFGKERSNTPPDPGKAEAIRAFVGFQKVRVDPSGALVKTRPEVELDLSAMAKGYAVDRLYDLLASRGCPAFMVEVGGEVRTRGLKPNGSPWIIGIEAPVEGTPFGTAILGALPLKDAALATSGDYRNFRRKEDEHWHHIIDPRTGANATHDLASASILDETCCSRADALATAVMVLGPDAGLALVERMPGVEALLILRSGDGSFAIRRTEGFPLLK